MPATGEARVVPEAAGDPYTEAPPNPNTPPEAVAT